MSYLWWRTGEEWELLKAFDRAFWIRQCLKPTKCLKNGHWSDAKRQCTPIKVDESEGGDCHCCPFRPINHLVGTAATADPVEEGAIVANGRGAFAATAAFG